MDDVINNALPVWAGVDIGGSHLGLSFFTSSTVTIGPEFPNLEVVSLPPRIEKFLENTTLWFDNDGQKMIDCVIGENMINMKLKNLSTTAEHLLQFLYVLICLVIDAQESLVRGSLKKLSWCLKGVGIGCPGQCKKGVLVAASNFPLLKNVPIVTELENLFYEKFRLKVTVCLINDADAAMAAEVWGDCDGKYDQYNNIAMVTLGTGIGMGLVLMGQLYQGSNGLVEGGHMIVSDKPSARQCPCGQIGCVEAYSSAANTAKRLRELDNLTMSNNRRSDSVKSPPRLTTLTTTAVKKPAFSTSKSPRRSESRSPPVFPRQRAGETNQVNFGNEANLSSSGNDDASSLSAKGAFDRYLQHDMNSVVVVEETAEKLAVMVINICRIIDPDAIIFGGGMSKSGELLLTLVEKHLRNRTWTVLPTQVKLLIASTRHADDVDAGILGAALVARRAYRGDCSDSTLTKNNDVERVDSDGGKKVPQNPDSKSSSSLLLRSLPWMGSGLLIGSLALYLYMHRRSNLSHSAALVIVNTTFNKLVHSVIDS